MAYFRIEYFSNALQRATSFEMIIPNDTRAGMPGEEKPYKKRPMKTLFLLHGYTGKAGNWVPEYLAEKYGLKIFHYQKRDLDYRHYSQFVKEITGKELQQPDMIGFFEAQKKFTGASHFVVLEKI